MVTQTVIIVDDRPTNRTIFGKLAASVAPDLRVALFGDPLAALGALDTLTPDLIIVDYSMPEMNGAEFTRAVRARAGTHDVPVIVITAHDDRDYRLTALEAGATDFLQSPVDLTEFRERVGSLLVLREQQRRLNSSAAAMGGVRVRGTGDALIGADADFFGQVLDNVPILISATDRDGKCLFANARFAALFGRSPDELVGTRLPRSPAEFARSEEADSRVVATGKAMPPYEETIDSGGVMLSYLTVKAPLADGEGHVVGVLTSSIDISGRKTAEQHLAHMARHDGLTGLPNRLMYRDRLQARIRAGQSGIALFLIDLDRFKAVNDTRGHRTGDLLLEQVAQRLTTTIRPGDTAARLGGDEFAVIATGIHDEAAAAEFADTLLRVLAQTYSLHSHDLVLSASIGISLSPRDGSNSEELLRTADLAMYEAKAAGGNTYRFFDQEMSRRAQTAATLEAELHIALSEGQFVAHYQPMFDARTGAIVAAEALIRWQHPVRGLLGPGEFVRVAEETGMIIPIGRWILGEACRQQARWSRSGNPVPRVSVNLSALQFERQEMAQVVAEVLAETGVPASALEVEIVESVLLNNRSAVADTLRTLRAMGVRIAIDDFGTGYSSLQYLRDLPVDALKIDRSFVSGLPESIKDAAIVHAITGLAHDLGLGIVAEGVETEEQRILLRTIGCDYLQGYHLARPAAPDALLPLLMQHATESGIGGA